MAYGSATGFDLIVDLPQSLLPTFNGVAAFAATHITAASSLQVASTQAPAGVHFVWTDFRHSIATRPGTDIVFDRVQSTTIHSEDNSPAVLAAKVTEFIGDSFSAITRDKLAEHIRPAFADPSKDVSKGVLTTVASHDEDRGLDKTGWEYRLICAYPNADLSDRFYSLVITIRQVRSYLIAEMRCERQILNSQVYRRGAEEVWVSWYKGVDQA